MEEQTDEDGGATKVYFIIAAFVLLCLSGLFSGLNLGLMSFSEEDLHIIIEGSDDEEDKRYAKTIYPLRKRGNLLLCTVLLGNTLVNAAIAILLADISGGIVGGIMTTFLIVIFGEIIPQSICSRHALYIGSRAVPIVWFFLYLVWIIAFPIAKVLDYALGREINEVYTKKMLLKLIELNFQDPDRAKESGLTPEDGKLLRGALTFEHQKVEKVMTPLDATFSIPFDAVLDKETVMRILNHGHTRIPVYKPFMSNNSNEDENFLPVTTSSNVKVTKGKTNLVSPSIIASSIPENDERGILKPTKSATNMITNQIIHSGWLKKKSSSNLSTKNLIKSDPNEIKYNNNIVAVLYAKDLVGIGFEREMQVEEVLNCFKAHKRVHYIAKSSTLKDAFHIMKTKAIHMLVVTDKEEIQQVRRGSVLAMDKPGVTALNKTSEEPKETKDEYHLTIGKSGQIELASKSQRTVSQENAGLDRNNYPLKICGIITMEDILEEIIQDEIVGEDDLYIDSAAVSPLRSSKVIQNSKRYDPTKLIQQISAKLKEERSYGALNTLGYQSIGKNLEMTRSEILTKQEIVTDSETSKKVIINTTISTAVDGEYSPVPTINDSEGDFFGSGETKNHEREQEVDNPVMRGSNYRNEENIALTIDDSQNVGLDVDSDARDFLNRQDSQV